MTYEQLLDTHQRARLAYQHYIITYWASHRIYAVPRADPRISLKTAHLFYVVPGTQKWSALLSDALTLAAFDTQDNLDTKVLEVSWTQSSRKTRAK